MSAISLSIPPQGGSIAEPSPAHNVRKLSAKYLSGYRVSTTQEDEVLKSLLPINLIGRAKIWMSRDLKIYSNSKYVYASFPIFLAMFWPKGDRGIPRSKSLSMIFTILTHCINTTDINNYFVRTQGRRCCRGAMLKESAHLAPLDDLAEKPTGENPV